MKNDLLVGTWALEKFEIQQPNGQNKPWGSNTRGLLIYTASGHVSVAINRDVVPNPSNPEKAIYDSTLFYAGTYSVEGETIHHQVTQATNPARIGRGMIRYVKMDGATMTLTTPKEDFGTATIVWKKIK